MAEDIAIEVKNVAKDFVLPHEKVNSIKGIFTSMFQRHDRTQEAQHALKDINITIKKGEFFGIVGRNGSGKSTLLKILAGIYQPTRGTIQTNGRLVPFIELGVGFNPELTGRDNVYLNGAMLGFSRKEIDEMYENIVEFAELEKFMDQKLKNYSSGMQVRLAFSMATRAEADILLVDEVLAVGDAAFQRKCFEYFKELKAKHKTVVFVTHDMNSVKEFCDRAMLIDESKMQLIGEPSKVAVRYSMLFMDKDTSVGKKQIDRLGNRDVEIVKTNVVVQEDFIEVNVKAQVHKSVDRIIYGLHVLGQDMTEITAMNNRMIQEPDIEKVAPGDIISFQWRMLNIFNDGKYTITLTLIDDVSTTLDWIIGAAGFTVRRIDRSTTPVLPPIKLQTSVKKGTG